MQIKETISDIETKFNIAGGIPLVALGSSLIRTCLSKIQFIAGIAIGLLGLIGQMIHTNSAKWENLTHEGLQHIIHGALNSLRALGEFLVGLTVIGSLGIFAAQYFSSNKFAPIYKYTPPAAVPV